VAELERAVLDRSWDIELVKEEVNAAEVGGPFPTACMWSSRSQACNALVDVTKPAE